MVMSHSIGLGPEFMTKSYEDLAKGFLNSIFSASLKTSLINRVTIFHIYKALSSCVIRRIMVILDRELVVYISLKKVVLQKVLADDLCC